MNCIWDYITLIALIVSVAGLVIQQRNHKRRMKQVQR